MKKGSRPVQTRLRLLAAGVMMFSWYGKMPRKPTPGSIAMPNWYLCSSDAWRSLGNALGGRLTLGGGPGGRHAGAAAAGGGAGSAGGGRRDGGGRRGGRSLSVGARAREAAASAGRHQESHRRGAHAGASLVESTAQAKRGKWPGGSA